MSKYKHKKEKSNMVFEKSDSDNDESEHELLYYINDRVKLMKEVLKTIKPKVIKSMAPDCIKDLDIEEINSMLLEELLGISNKRLKNIFTGQNLSGDSSSTDPEEEKQTVDVISLDDVSDDDFIIDVDSRKSRNGKFLKKEIKDVKKEVTNKRKMYKAKNEPLKEENLMTVLELLELQARARAIRSQLMLETNKPIQEKDAQINADLDTDDAVIIELPKNDEIIIGSTDSENESSDQKTKCQKTTYTEGNIITEETEIDSTKKKKNKLSRSFLNDQPLNIPTNIESDVKELEKIENSKTTNVTEAEINNDNLNEENSFNKVVEQRKETNVEYNYDTDEIILIVDQEEMDGIGNE